MSQNPSLELKITQIPHMIAYRYLAAILNLCPFDLFPINRYFGTILWCPGDFKEVLCEEKNSVAICSKLDEEIAYFALVLCTPFI